MQSTGVRYHRSTENLDDDGCVKVRPLTVGYCRFTVLERVLIVVVCVLFIVTVVLGVLYGTARAANGTAAETRGSQSEQEKKPSKELTPNSNLFFFTIYTPINSSISIHESRDIGLYLSYSLFTVSLCFEKV